MGTPPLDLRALLFCVFDKDEGPMVKCSDPPHALGVQFKFKILGRYLLPETFVQGRVVSVGVEEDKVIVGAPVYIEDTQYSRNCFQFNICLVASSTADPEPQRDVAQHLAEVFHTLEVDTKLLSSASEVESKVEHIQDILAQVRQQLNATEECFVRVGDSHAVSFKVRRWQPSLPETPLLSSVPVPLVNLDALLPKMKLEGGRPDEVTLPQPWDSTLLPVASLIDGSRTVQQICDLVDKHAVILILRHLLHFGLVSMIDEIRPEGRYRLTPLFHTAFQDATVASDALRYATAGRREAGDEAALQALQALYCQLNGTEQTWDMWQDANAEELERQEISAKHFLTFGLLQGFVEKIDTVVGVLTKNEFVELERLRSNVIPQKKQTLRDIGLSSAEVNRHPEIKPLVSRMNLLKGKQIGRGFVQQQNAAEEDLMPPCISAPL